MHGRAGHGIIFLPPYCFLIRKAKHLMINLEAVVRLHGEMMHVVVNL